MPVFMLSSCALIINGHKQSLKVVTDEPGAVVYLNDLAVDTTPCLLKVKRSVNPPSLKVSKQGFNTQDIELKTKFNETSILNFINPFGWIIDVGSGASIKYRPLDTIQLKQGLRIKI